MPPPYQRRGRRRQVTALAVIVCVVIAAGLFTRTPTAAAAPAESGSSGAIGSFGSSPLGHAPGFRQAFGQQALAGPDGVALDPDGDIWVADTGHDRIAEFTASGHLVTSFGLAARFGGGLSQPEGLAIDAAGHIWVADTGHDRLVEFTRAGHVLAMVGSPGSGHGQLNQPVALAVLPSGGVWVADQGNRRVEEFSAGGRYRASLPVPTPAGVALDSRGDVWVSSPSYAPGNSVEEFSPAGRQLLSFGTTQAGYGDLGDTGGIAVGPAGRIYVAQPDYGLVSVFSPAGSFDTEFGLQPGTAQASENLEFPQSLAVTAAGQVWVADSGGDRIAEFGTAAGAGLPAAPAAPGGSSIPLITGGVVLAAALAGLGWFLARRKQARPPSSAAPDAQAGPASPPSPGLSRRRLLTNATALSGVAVGATALPANLRKALAATLRDPPGGSLSDIEHIVILMQENRSFDHYFGTMPGVRGFSDPTAIRLPDGNPVFRQPHPGHAQGYLTPFRYDTRITSAQATPGTDHSWPTQHQAWDNGKMDRWVAAKGPYTMGYFTQGDIPFQWALAQAFTVCDNYHCSVFGPTNPNRLYMWTGMIDPAGTRGGPVTDDSPAYNNVTLSWTTYPERLERAGISWQVYQEEDNFDDNALAWFTQFARAPAASPLAQRGIRKRAAGWFEADARAGRLPQVSWLVAPTAQSEHPDYFPAAGAEYIASKLDAIAGNEDLWHKTLFILCYDENDGLFDHVPPPTPPAGTAGEFVGGEPIGLGFRVPAVVISPWSAGGHVCSDVLDHTSLIRVLEKRFGVTEPNISAWRRRTCGDFTTALRFSGPAAGYPRSPSAISLAVAQAGLLTAQREVFVNPAPLIPAVNPPLPRQ
jgi:phospholipase C